MRYLLLIRGIHHDLSYRGKGDDYRRTHRDARQKIIGPLRREGHSVDVLLSTYATKHVDDLKRVYGPVDVLLTQKRWQDTAKTECILAALDWVAERRASYDFVIVYRFDLTLHRPWPEMGFDPDKINFLWRETGFDTVPRDRLWRDHRRVGDAILAFPTRLLGPFQRGVEEVAERVVINVADNCHRLLWHLKDKIDTERDVHIVFDGYYDSDPARMRNPAYDEIDCRTTAPLGRGAR
nr:hypothetical protein TetV2_00041 [Oceanusvirus sp.]